MYMNLDQYHNYKSKIIQDLYNKKVPNPEDYLTQDFSKDDFADLIKEMESDGLINNVRYVHGGQEQDCVAPSFEHVVITPKGMSVLE